MMSRLRSKQVSLKPGTSGTSATWRSLTRLSQQFFVVGQQQQARGGDGVIQRLARVRLARALHVAQLLRVVPLRTSACTRQHDETAMVSCLLFVSEFNLSAPGSHS